MPSIRSPHVVISRESAALDSPLPQKAKSEPSADTAAAAAVQGAILPPCHKKRQAASVPPPFTGGVLPPDRRQSSHLSGLPPLPTALGRRRFNCNFTRLGEFRREDNLAGTSRGYLTGTPRFMPLVDVLAGGHAKPPPSLATRFFFVGPSRRASQQGN